MTPDPIEFRIIQNLQAALQAIRSEDGFHYDVQAAAVRLDPNVDIESLIGDAAQRPFVLIDAHPESWNYQPAQQLVMVMPFTVHWISEATETTDEARLQTYFRGCADVEKAIATDITRGGLAFDTLITKRTLDRVVDGREVWAMVDGTIRVYREYGKPNG